MDYETAYNQPFSHIYARYITVTDITNAAITTLMKGTCSYSFTFFLEALTFNIQTFIKIYVVIYDEIRKRKSIYVANNNISKRVFLST